MSITHEQTRVALAPADQWSRRARIVGWSLGLGWLALFLSLLALGEREASYDQLESGLRTGQISEVEETSTDFDNGSTGRESVSVRWRDGLISRTATLTHTSDPQAAAEARREGPARSVVNGSIADHLTALNPDVRVSQGEQRYPSFTVAGWQCTPVWPFLAYLALLIGTLGLIAGPRPWRATRWAWGWLVLLAPGVGVPAYFFFGGPVGRLRPHPPGRIWLTGGWAFLLALILGGAAGS